MKPRLVLYVATLAAVLTSRTLLGTLTLVNPTAGAEPNLFGGLSGNPSGNVMDTLYGAGNYTRVDDSVDRLWMNASGAAQIRALFGSTTLLYYNSASNPNLFIAAPASGGYTTQSFVSLPATSEQFNWRITNAFEGAFSSIPSQNGGADHMVTFRITGNSGHPSNVIGNYVTGWEAAAGLGDSDYQDLVVEVSSVFPIPEPSSLALLSLGILGVAGVIRRKHSGRNSPRDCDSTVGM